MPSRRAALPYPEPVTRTSGPWRAVLEHRAPAFDPERLLDARNMHPEFLRGGGPWRQRAAFERMTAGGTGLNAGARIRAVEVASGAGGRWLFVVAGAKLYYTPYGTPGVWTEVVGVTIAAGTSNLFLVPFAGTLIVSTYQNRPQKVSLDGAFTVSNLTDMVVPFYGRPVVYAAKLFGIVSSGGVQTNRLVWSEELDPDHGYTNVNDTNEWVLGQTSSEALIALCGSNQGLYYFRATSVGLIVGEVTPDFRTTATHDAVSSDFGTIYPDAVRRIGEGGDVWFLDQRGVVRRIRGAGLADAPGEQHAVTNQLPAPSAFTATIARVPNPSLVLAHLGFNRYPTTYDLDTGDYYGTWSIGAGDQNYPTVVAAVDAGQQEDRLLVGTSTGHVYRLRLPSDATLPDDADAAGATAAVRAWLEPAPVGFAAHREATWDRAVIDAPHRTQAAWLEAGPSDADAAWPAASATAPASSTGAGYVRAAVTLAEHTEVALDVRQTRYLRARLTARDPSPTRLAVSGLRFEGTAVGGDPDAD